MERAKGIQTCARFYFLYMVEEHASKEVLVYELFLEGIYRVTSYRYSE